MSTVTLSAPRTLLEFAPLTTTLVTSSDKRVDTERGIIYGVKVVGRYSPNSHGDPRATRGTEYTRQALEEEKRQLEGMSVRTNHPDRTNPGQSRDVQEGLGELRNCRLEWSGDRERDGIYADLHLLKTVGFSATLMEAAQTMPRRFGLSHNADGIGQVIDGVFVVESVPYVRGVDVVDKPATTIGIFESLENKETPVTTPATTAPAAPVAKAKKTFRAVIEGHKDPVIKARMQKIFKKLLEDDMYGGGMMEEPTTMEKGGEPSHHEHAANAIKAVCLDESLDSPGKIAKIRHYLKAMDDGVSEADGKGEGKEGDQGKDGGKDKNKVQENKDCPTMESKEQELEREVKQLKAEKSARKLCESLDYKAPTETQVKIVTLLESEAERKEAIEGFKKAATPAPAATTPGATTAPNTPAGARHRDLLEDQEATAFAAMTPEQRLAKLR